MSALSTEAATQPPSSQRRLLQEQEQTQRTLSSQYEKSVFRLLIATSDHGDHHFLTSSFLLNSLQFVFHLHYYTLMAFANVLWLGRLRSFLPSLLCFLAAFGSFTLFLQHSLTLVSTPTFHPGSHSPGLYATSLRTPSQFWFGFFVCLFRFCFLALSPWSSL